MKKYELTTNTKMYLGKKLFQIRALIAFGNVEAGELGGWLEKKENLSQEGDCWVTGNGRVTGNSRVTGNGWVTDNEDIAYVRGFGSEYRPTTFFRCEDGKIRTQCGCFYGTIDEFRKQVKETHEDSKFAKEYLMIADLMELHFE